MTAYFKLFELYPPVLKEGVKESLELLSKKYTLILSSNLLFLSHNEIVPLLEKLGIAQYFTEMNFSSQKKCSKPNIEMYKDSKGNLSSYHIGDNVITDYSAPLSYGIKPILIESKDLILEKIKEL